MRTHDNPSPTVYSAFYRLQTCLFVIYVYIRNRIIPRTRVLSRVYIFGGVRGEPRESFRTGPGRGWESRENRVTRPQNIKTPSAGRTCDSTRILSRVKTRATYIIYMRDKYGSIHMCMYVFVCVVCVGKSSVVVIVVVLVPDVAVKYRTFRN